MVELIKRNAPCFKANLHCHTTFSDGKMTAEQVKEMDTTEELKQLETRKFTFRCGCTVDKILPTIRAMKQDFADILEEQGYIEASCPRCGAKYNITAEQL